MIVLKAQLKVKIYFTQQCPLKLYIIGMKKICKNYNNPPPKAIMNAIWGSCFDYKDFNKKIMNESIQDRIYNTWQVLQEVLNRWVSTDETDFLKYIKNNNKENEY
jgi:hypothetical protein